MFQANAGKYAEALAAFREALRKSGFSPEESTQILIKPVEHPIGRPFFGGRHWNKRRPDWPGSS